MVDRKARIPGQTPSAAGAIRAGNLVFTSGIVAPEVLGSEGVSFTRQVSGALQALLTTLAGAGAGRTDVVRVEAFLGSPQDFAEWNAAFSNMWPDAAPARTTLVSDFAMAGILIEIQAIAVLDQL
ncbi:RidA family protein [soil metagenome]